MKNPWSFPSGLSALEAGDGLGDEKLGRGVTDFAMFEYERIADVFLERHVAHDAHRAEALGRALRHFDHRLGRERACHVVERQRRYAAVADGVGMIDGPC